MAGILRTDTIQNSNTSTIITQTNTTTITIGTTGQTIALASGASSSGFGASGAVNWDTTPKTTGFTAVSGNGYFVNTTSGAITVTLPATPAAGNIVAIADYANTSATNNITVGRNGSKIDGETKDARILINGQVYTLIYVDSTEGWKTISQAYNQITLPAFVAATGGTITTSGDYKIHTFTGPGTFTVSCAGNSAGSNSVDYLVVAGGAGGGLGNNASGGGGGAGGLRFSAGTYCNSSPLKGSVLTVTATAYPITVGAGSGGATTSTRAPNGSPSIFSIITSVGGGGGGSYFPPANTGNPGGSGGGGAGDANLPVGSSSLGGTGNTPPVSPSQGNDGGAGFVNGGSYPAGGGGGAASAGTTNPNPNPGGPGGGGLQVNIDTNNYYWAGGGGGAGWCAPVNGGNGGIGGGGGGASRNSTAGTGGGSALNSGGNGTNNWPTTSVGGNGGTNTGGGGGGNNLSPIASSSGGSGIVIIRYKYQ